MIENLPLLTPDPSRGARTMAQCHDKLAARRRPNLRIVTIERLLCAGLCLVYLLSMAGNILRIVLTM